MKRMMSVVLALVVAGAACVASADALSDAKDRRKARRAEVEQLVKSGAAEEGADGYLVAKKKEKDVESVVKAENADRKAGYEELAKNSNGLSVETIAKKAGEINRKKAAQ